MNPALPTVLIIEKDQFTRELYERGLSQEFHVLCASNEQEAVRMLNLETIKAVVFEPSGFGERGWELLAQIKIISAGHRLPIILCSSWDERQRGLEMGASAYFTKPVLPTILQQTLHRVISIT